VPVQFEANLVDD
jgi:hypothetical protein